MKNWKIFSLIAVAVVLAGSLFSCKDKEEVVVEPYGLYTVAVQSVTAQDRTVKKNYCDSLKKEISTYLSAEQKGFDEMMPGSKTQDRMNKLVEQVAAKYKDGYEFFPEDKYAQVVLAMQSGSTVAYEAILRIYGNTCVIYYPTISVIPSSAYEMVMPYVTNENVDDTELSYVTDSLKEFVLPTTWPQYGINKAKAIELYDQAIAEQVKGLSICEALCPEDTMSLVFGFALVYNNDVIIKSNEIRVNGKGVTLVK